ELEDARDAHSARVGAEAQLRLGEVEGVTRRRAAACERDAEAARALDRHPCPEAAQDGRRRDTRCDDDAVGGDLAVRGRQPPAGAAPAELDELLAFADLDAVLAQPRREPCRQLLGPDEAVDAGMEAAGNPRRVERRLERRELPAVQLVDRAALVPDLAQSREDQPVVLEPL